MNHRASLGPDLPARRDLTLADLGRKAWDFFNTPYRAPDESRIAGGQPPRLDVVDYLVGKTVKNLLTLPQRALESSARYAETGEYDPVPIVESAILPMTGGMPFAPRGAVGAGGGRLPPPELPMDRASRSARASAMGYDKTRFYRGDRHGDVPQEFPHVAFFSRDREYSAGFARQGGRRAPEEYRLNLQHALHDFAPVTAEVYARLVAAARHRDPKLSRDLADLVGPGKSVDWLMEFARRNPNMIVLKTGRMLRRAIEVGARNSNEVFRRAGFDALDFGTDILKLGGAGIRSKDARFDPKNADSHNIMASVPPIGAGIGVGTAALSDPNLD
jgi:hypothetical protein